MNEKINYTGANKAKIIEVIETIIVIGAGTKEDPARYLYQYWDLKGKLLAQKDSLKEQAL